MPNNQENINHFNDNLKSLTLNAKSKLSPELLFLIACCQTNPSKDVTKDIHAFLNAENIKHDDLISLANQHGILPLVYLTFRDAAIEDQDLLSRFKQAYMSIAQRNILMSAELIRIMKLLKENNIQALAFKGPALSQMAYGDITLRQYVDLDILVDENDAFKAGKLMSKNGHIAILPLTILSNKTCLHAAKDFSLMSEPGGVHTELHWRLFEKKYNISLLSCAVDKKCQMVKINNKEIKTLQTELLLVYLCLHGAKHAFERIEWICDIDRLIRSSDIDWGKAIAIADQSHSKRSFYLGLSLAHHLFHTELHSISKNNIETHDVLWLQTMIISQLSQKKKVRSEFKKNKETFFYHSKLFDTRSDTIRFYLSVFFKISTSDCQTFILPENLKFLYIFLRPLRLLWSYGKRMITKNAI